MIVFGGAAKSGEMVNDVYVLNTATWTWEAVETSVKFAQSLPWKEGPSPRAGSCACGVGGARPGVVLYGGAEMKEGGGLKARCVKEGACATRDSQPCRIRHRTQRHSTPDSTPDQNAPN